jgi:hypothetical protein
VKKCKSYLKIHVIMTLGEFIIVLFLCPTLQGALVLITPLLAILWSGW